jgi:hypothetical protein
VSKLNAVRTVHAAGTLSARLGSVDAWRSLRTDTTVVRQPGRSSPSASVSARSAALLLAGGNPCAIITT